MIASYATAGCSCVVHYGSSCVNWLQVQRLLNKMTANWFWTAHQVFKIMQFLVTLQGMVSLLVFAKV